MPTPSKTALAEDSLGYAFSQCAGVVASVLAGRSLTQAFDLCWRTHPRLLPATRGAIQDLAYGTLRDFGRGDFMLAHLLHRSLPAATIRALLLVALHRLEARSAEAHTIVNQAVNAAKVLEGGHFHSLVNAVLRNFIRRHTALLAQAIDDEVAQFRHPRWWIARMRSAYPLTWQEVLLANNVHPPMTLRPNTRRYSASHYASDLDAACIEYFRIDDEALCLSQPIPVERLPGFGEGRVSVQDYGAQRAAPMLDLQDGQRVLDACAAPGGKSAHILETAEVALTALDVDPDRLATITQNLKRLGLMAQVVHADCRRPETWWDGRPFDRVLADVPCSASGVARRHPDIKWLRREEDIAQFARTQRGILEALWPVLAPDGKLLYATCSVFPEENEQQVAAFVGRHADCVRLPLGGEPALQLLPGAEHDGFYYALLQKIA